MKILIYTTFVLTMLVSKTWANEIQNLIAKHAAVEWICEDLARIPNVSLKVTVQLASDQSRDVNVIESRGISIEKLRELKVEKTPILTAIPEEKGLAYTGSDFMLGISNDVQEDTGLFLGHVDVLVEDGWIKQNLLCRKYKLNKLL